MKLLTAICAVAAAGSIAAWTTAVPHPENDERSVEMGAGPTAASLDTIALSRFTTRLRQNNPFRLDRKPTAVRYNPWEPVVVAAAPTSRPAKPNLVLTGLLGGPPWNALIIGVPGRESGLLLQLGDSANGIRFVALRGDTALVAGFDTTWSLTARSPWR